MLECKSNSAALVQIYSLPGDFLLEGRVYRSKERRSIDENMHALRTQLLLLDRWKDARARLNFEHVSKTMRNFKHGDHSIYLLQHREFHDFLST